MKQMSPASLVSFLLCIQNKIPLKSSWNDSIKELMEVMLTIMLLLCDFLVKLSKLTQVVILMKKTSFAQFTKNSYKSYYCLSLIQD